MELAVGSPDAATLLECVVRRRHARLTRPLPRCPPRLGIGSQEVAQVDDEPIPRRQARLVPLQSRNHLILEDEPAYAQFLEEIRSFLGA